jgi:hypothetical protein
MKKTVLFVFLSLSFGFFAQEFSQSVGGQVLVGTFQKESVFGESNDITLVPGIVYKATLGFELTSNKSFAVSAYPFFGLYYNSNFGGYAGVQVPIMAEFYFGEIEDNNFNVGLGLAWGHITQGGSGGSVFGPQVAVGGQVYFLDRMVGVRTAYTLGLNKSKDDFYFRDDRRMFSISLLYPIGQ